MQRVNTNREEAMKAQGTGAHGASEVEQVGEKKERTRNSNWWEEEGRKRKDSVWLGTDKLDLIVSQEGERVDV